MDAFPVAKKLPKRRHFLDKNVMTSLHFYFSNLDETTRSVYKENVRVNAALEYHVAESKDLKKVD